MVKINSNYLQLQESYLFSTVRQKTQAYQAAHPQAEVIRLGVGDVTLPLAKCVITALHDAVDEQADAKTFHGYPPELGYEFLRELIADNDFAGLGIKASDIIISDGAKSDAANIQEIFSADATIAVGDPVYPVYVDANVMAGRIRDFDETTGRWANLIYLPTDSENNFVPSFPDTVPDLIYLCFPNNPTGTVLTKDQLQHWVDYANQNHAIILFDAAYECFIREDNIPHSIYECDGAKTCAIELRSFSKSAGFTGVRLGYVVIPEELTVDGVSLQKLWARRQSSKFNGAPYITQRAGAAIYSEQGKMETKAQVDYYLENARLIRAGLTQAGFTYFGGINSPYVWLKTPQGMSSWSFFDELLQRAQVIGTPGSGFGPHGEGYFRLSSFGDREVIKTAIARIQALTW